MNRRTFYTEGEPKLGRRLVVAALQAAGISLVLAGMLMGAYAYFALRSDLHQVLHVQARVAAYNSAAPILFDDPEAANETLGALRAAPAVVCAALYRIDGSLFAQYAGSPGSPEDVGCVDGPPGERGDWSNGGLMYASEPVRQEQRLVGRIVIGASMGPMFERVRTYIVVGLLSAVFALLLAYLQVLRIRKDMDRTEQRLENLVYIDPVSGLPNRRAANGQLDIRHWAVSPRGFLLALLDLDDFKLINDTFGHAMGDALLRALGDRLTAHLGREAQIYRYGGDEFIVIVPDCAASEKAAYGERLLRLFDTPLRVESQAIVVHGSVGLAHFPDDAAETPALLRAADTAMYRAKRSGKNAYASFDPSMDMQLRRKLRLQAELRRAIDQHELALEYQPIVALDDGSLVGVEALVRWHHPELGLIGPAEFIPAAEESGLILDIGQWVLDAACLQLRHWQRGDLPQLRALYVAVNVSAKQLSRGLSGQIHAALAHSNLPPHALQIEITEYSLVEALDSNVAQLAALRQTGVKVAIDDFGTGLSSLGYLKRLPIDKLKIDRTFVKDLPGSSDDAAIAGAIVSLAHNLGLEIVAEGVETEEQAAWLRAAGCSFGQGYLFSRPVHPTQIEQLFFSHLRSTDAAPVDEALVVPVL